MSTKKAKLNARILAWILAILMVLGIAVLTVQMIILNVQEKKAAEEKAQQEQTEDTHDH
ncbi:MAG: hypothetical protein J6A84_00065 [Clostridia bacterium]|nr:hypothetical protein [Clostridia bacterium]